MLVAGHDPAPAQVPGAGIMMKADKDRSQHNGDGDTAVLHYCMEPVLTDGAVENFRTIRRTSAVNQYMHILETTTTNHYDLSFH